MSPFLFLLLGRLAILATEGLLSWRTVVLVGKFEVEKWEVPPLGAVGRARSAVSAGGFGW